MEHARPTHGSPGLSRSRLGSTSASRLRVVPWQGDPYTALIGPRRDGRTPRAPEIMDCLTKLGQRGVQQAITPAMSAVDGRPFVEAGFGLHERLYLLSRPIPAPPPATQSAGSTRALRILNGRRWHRDTVLDIDRRAFEPFWQFDRTTLAEARRATPTSKFRVAKVNGRVVGYAVAGRAGARGYLQRLAVDPEQKGQGIGTDLVHDSIRWLHRRGATSILVNTQERNARALALYEHLGFIRQPQGLLVLRWDNLT